MFDDLIRRIEQIPKTQRIEVQVRLDEDGYLDRRCPAAECGSAFKVLLADWRDKVVDDQAWCAICGEVGAPLDFATPDQMRQFRQQGRAHIAGQLNRAITGAERRSVNSGLVSMTWSYKPGAMPIVVLAEAAPLMTQRSSCEACGTRYASIGAAFFCPACGHNSALTTFAGALATVRRLMDLAARMQDVIEGQDEAADAARQTIENSLVRVWFSYQRFAEATYKARYPNAEPPRRNAFQNLAESDRLWKAAGGRTYADILSRDEHRDLVRLVEARNVFHQDGFVDADYVARSGDRRFKVGQRLIVTPADTLRLAELAEKLSASI